MSKQLTKKSEPNTLVNIISNKRKKAIKDMGLRDYLTKYSKKNKKDNNE